MCVLRRYVKHCDQKLSAITISARANDKNFDIVYFDFWSLNSNGKLNESFNWSFVIGRAPVPTVRVPAASCFY